MPRRTLTEAQPTTTAAPVDGQPGRFLIQLITPGWGSSGYYGPQVLEAAAAAQVFPAGLHMYADHPSLSENRDRPERSVEDLRAVLTSNAAIDSDGGLTAEALVFGTHRVALEEMRDAIGVSIRAAAEVEQGEAEGRRGTIVRELVEGISADFVTHAGRGGRIVDVLESARPTVVVERAVTHGVAEATANDTREALQQSLRETYGGEESWVWVRDFDDSTVWFEHETPEATGTYAEAYSLADDGAVTLAGERTEVRARTEYVPVNNDPAGPSNTQTTTEADQEVTMGNIQVDEAEHRRVTEAAGRVTTLESERDTAVRERDEAITRAETAESERDEARGTIAESQRQTIVNRIIGESAGAASVQMDEFQHAGVAGRVVLDDDGNVNEAATRTAIDTAVASIREAQGAGRPRGLGWRPDTSTATESDLTQDQVDEARRAARGMTTTGA